MIECGLGDEKKGQKFKKKKDILRGVKETRCQEKRRRRKHDDVIIDLKIISGAKPFADLSKQWIGIEKSLQWRQQRRRFNVFNHRFTKNLCHTFIKLKTDGIMDESRRIMETSSLSTSVSKTNHCWCSCSKLQTSKIHAQYLSHFEVKDDNSTILSVVFHYSGNGQVLSGQEESSLWERRQGFIPSHYLGSWRHRHGLEPTALVKKKKAVGQPTPDTDPPPLHTHGFP